MPVGDDIFMRLRAATDAELRAVAKPLDVDLTADREVDVVSISKEYRSAAGNTLANVFRGAHEMPYREILDDAVSAATSAAAWGSVSVEDSAEDAWLEDYVSVAFAYAAGAATQKPSNQEKARARKSAVALLEGKHVQPPTAGDVALGIGVGGAAIGAAGVAVVMVGALPIVALGALLHVVSPSAAKVSEATLGLIHVRKRLEQEAVLLAARGAK